MPLYTHSFAPVTPPARYDSVAWTRAPVDQAADIAGPWTEIATPAIPVDPSPESPNPVDLTVTTATIERGYFRFRFDTGPATSASPYTDPVFSPAEPNPGLPILADLKALVNVTKADKEPLLQRNLDAAINWVRDETGRQFELLPANPAAAAVPITVRPRGRRMIRIPDAREVSEISLDATALTSDEWVLHKARHGGTYCHVEVGYRATTAEITGKFGLDPFPDDLAELILTLAARRYKAREAEYADAIASEEYGLRTYYRRLPQDMQAVLAGYQIPTDTFAIA